MWQELPSLQSPHKPCPKTKTRCHRNRFDNYKVLADSVPMTQSVVCQLKSDAATALMSTWGARTCAAITQTRTGSLSVSARRAQLVLGTRRLDLYPGRCMDSSVSF
ncbi:hypothetical protein BaRGS_00017527 [Batillaria attramentaria]|uniref:Uncharacterized protein n=1 Tax=Batillaria attramentaria TaxID=370345 RepID=A0ABD0KW52_9CAEN